MAGQHHRNPTAQAAARGEFQSPPGAEVFGFDFEPVLELNKETIVEITRDLDYAKAADQDPRPILTRYNPQANPDKFDYVVYNRPQVGRRSALAIRDGVEMARLRWSEHIRIPLTEIRAREAEVRAEHERRSEPQH